MPSPWPFPLIGCHPSPLRPLYSYRLGSFQLRGGGHPIPLLTCTPPVATLLLSTQQLLKSLVYTLPVVLLTVLWGSAAAGPQEHVPHHRSERKENHTKGGGSRRKGKWGARETHWVLPFRGL